MGDKAVFIDRDGTINVNVEYLDNPQNFQMYPGVGEGIKKLQESAFKIIVITNQSGIARGFFSEKTLEEIHRRMIKELLAKGASVDAIYYCPHHPEDNCDCRKPKTGLFEKAVKDHGIDVFKSYLIGDRMLDVEAGHKMGLKTVLIPEKKEMVRREMAQSEIKPDYLCNDFYSGVEWILKNRNSVD